MLLAEKHNSVADALAKAGHANANAMATWLFEDALHLQSHELSLEAKRELTSREERELDTLTQRVLAEEPLQYVLGHTSFYGLDIACEPPVFIPRPETEQLVEEASRKLPSHAHVLDLCSGTGAIAIALAHLVPSASLIASEKNPRAISLIKKNVQAHEVGARVEVLQSDLFEAVPSRLRFDAIVSNPPYIPLTMKGQLAPQVVEHEDEEALFSGTDGLICARHILEQAPTYLKSGAFIALELGEYNVETMASELRQTSAWQDICVKPDFTGRPRFLWAKRA